MTSFPCPWCSAAAQAGSRSPSCARSPIVCGYRIESLLGRGAMGIVYGARAQPDAPLVAVKSL